MSCTLWILAAVTVLVNVPSIAVYARERLPHTSEEDVTRGALWYVVSRSAALIASTVCAVVAASLDLGTQWLFGIATATALVQLIDVPIAAKTGAKQQRRKMVGLTVLVLALQVGAIAAAVLIPCR